MKNIASIFIAILFINLCASCHKTATDPCANDGTGGQLSIVAFPQHHGRSIPNLSNFHDTAYAAWMPKNDTIYVDTVYVKFNTQNGSAIDVNKKPTSYDVIYTGEPGEDHVHLTGLKCGQYYLYATGWDTILHLKVHGGIPFTTTQTAGEVDLNVAISEE